MTKLEAARAAIAAHTPGPWVIDEVDKGNSAHVLGAPSGFCCDIVATLPMGYVESEANARLIAAAPELLTALTNLMARLEDLELTDCEEQEPTMVAARAAIAKAVQS